MKLADPPLVGGPAARRLLGAHAAGDIVLLGQPTGGATADLEQSLGEFPARLRGHLTAQPGWLLELAELAAERDDAPLLLVTADLKLSPVALLDLLDGPADRTAALTIERAALEAEPRQLSPVRVARDRRLHSVGTARHVATSPTAYSVGVLRVRAADRARAARLWRAADAARVAADPSVAPFDLALLALVRGGLPVAAVPLGPYTVRRGEDHAPGAPGSPWQQRLRGSSRGNDGALSTAVVRPVSRRVTAYGLRHGWVPNVVTAVSLLVGLAAAALAAVDHRVSWALAALLLHASLVVDCVDGEIARFTRRYSALGAWLDGVGDRVKEFAMVGAVAWVAARRGDPLWTLAIVLLALLAIRHVEDYDYTRRMRCAHLGRVPDLLDLDRTRDLGPATARTTVPPASARTVATRTVKQVLHLPIAERYLIMSLGLLTGSPSILLWALTAAVALALLWTQVGRTLAALLRRDAFDGGRPDPQLAAQLDLGLLARPAGGLAGRPARWRFGWQLPGLLLAAEAAAVLIALAAVPEADRWAGYAWLGAVAWHRYDLVYRLRETGRGSAEWVGRAGLGSITRIVVLLVAGALGWPTAAIMAWGALALICLYAAESATAWRVTARSSRPAEPEVTP